MATQKDLADFFKDLENAQKLNGLVEDIRGALMDYQVCAPKKPTLIPSNVWPRRRYNKKSTMRTASRS